VKPVVVGMANDLLPVALADIADQFLRAVAMAMQNARTMYKPGITVLMS
jgi:hypothetical protein